MPHTPISGQEDNYYPTLCCYTCNTWPHDPGMICYTVFTPAPQRDFCLREVISSNPFSTTETPLSWWYKDCLTYHSWHHHMRTTADTSGTTTYHKGEKFQKFNFIVFCNRHLYWHPGIQSQCKIFQVLRFNL